MKRCHDPSISGPPSATPTTVTPATASTPPGTAGTGVRKRCAVYTRKSSEEGLDQDYNSIDAQRDAGHNYIASQKHEGWIPVVHDYDDPAYSGGNMERPALKRLLADIELGLIDIVVVYKIDRLTRSLADFAKMVETFDQHRVPFVAVTQQFNTTTSMGRLTLNILLSFAQFEREVTGERIRDKIAAAKARGKWMGGVPSLGYDVVDRKLVINEREAATVRRLFTELPKIGSATLFVQLLRAEGVTTKSWIAQNGNNKVGHLIDKGSLYKILHNRTYLGEISHKGVWYPGEHEPILTQAQWEVVHGAGSSTVSTTVSTASPRKANPVNDAFDDRSHRNRVKHAGTNGAQSITTASPALLKGLLFTHDGYAMTPHTTGIKKNGRQYRYYVSQKVLKQGSSPPYQAHSDRDEIRSLPAAEIEAVVLAQVRALLSNETMINDVTQALHDRGIDEATVREHLRGFDAIWGALFPVEQARLVQLLVSKVMVAPEAVTIEPLVNGFTEFVLSTLSRRS